MAKTAIKAGQIVAFAAMGVLLAIVVAVNAVGAIFSQWLTDFFGGRGTGTVTEVTLEGADAMVQEIEGEGVVLLKNENGALPLNQHHKVNVFGWGSTDAGFIRSGSGSGDASEHNTGGISIGFLDGLTQVGYEPNPELTRLYQKFASEKDATKSLSDPSDEFFKLYEPPKSVYTSSVMSQALSYSENALIVISRSGGEGQDLPRYQTNVLGTATAQKSGGKYQYDKDESRHYLEISQEEEDLIDVVCNAGFKRVVVILNAVNTMELGFLNNTKIDAALWVGGPGQSGCLSVGYILRGGINPSGRTADTFAYDMTTNPTFEHTGEWGVEQYSGYSANEYAPNSSAPGSSYIDYNEGVYVGYKWYETADATGFWNTAYAGNKWGVQGYNDVVQYPFGYGLSYGSFVWKVKDWSLRAGSNLDKEGKIELTVSVKNTSDRFSGKDVVQLYYSPIYKNGGVEKSAVNLGAYIKTDKLKPQEEKEYTLSLKVEDMKSYDAYGKGTYVLEAGAYELSLRTDAHTVADCANSTVSYNVASDILYNTDSETQTEVKNRFTGATAYAGVAVDGKSTGENITYLTRSNFEGTFPAVRPAVRSKNSLVSNLGLHWYENKTSNEATTTGSTATSYRFSKDGEWDTELMMELGKDYEDERWEQLVAQISKSELITLVEDAGFRTAEIASVGKPKCIDVDGPTGLNANNVGGTATLGGSGNWTAYPVEMVLSATWNDELARRMGQSVGLEAAESKISGWYAPGANIHRSPFDGRNFEYYSEDAFLSGKMCANVVRGCLSKGLYPYMKHFAVNETEEQRSGLYTWLTEQALREIYLRPFEIAVKEGKANAIMTSFNCIGAVWAGGNRALLEDITRGEWGFRGTMLTDWSSGGDYMHLDQGLACGTDAWLNGAHSGVGGHNNKDTNVGIRDMQRAAKNILYTYCNTYYFANTEGEGMEIKEAEKVFPVWIFILVGFDVLAAGGIAVWAFFTVRKIKKTNAASKSVTENQE